MGWFSLPSPATEHRVLLFGSVRSGTWNRAKLWSRELPWKGGTFPIFQLRSSPWVVSVLTQPCTEAFCGHMESKQGSGSLVRSLQAS